MTLNKWRRATEWFMTALALVFLFAYSWEVLARTHILLCEMVINIIWMAFIVDCVVSILLAKDKKTWFKDNLLMLESIALPVFRPLRHRIVGEPGFRRFGYPFRQVSEEADFRVFECSVYHIFKSFVS